MVRQGANPGREVQGNLLKQLRWERYRKMNSREGQDPTVTTVHKRKIADWL